MKTSTDPRHKKRETRVSAMFSKSFTPDFTSPVDSYIEIAAPEWPLKNINKMDLAVLRVATDELLHSDTPEKVVIDEAVEIAKKYGAENSASFINGVLGTILKNKQKL
ncbi:MAG: transcription antitermination factor NusB [bacterium]